jgi:hypothetical protein
VRQVGSGPVAPEAAGGAARVGGSAMAVPIVNQAPPDAPGWGDDY